MPDPFQVSATHVDLSPRFQETHTVVGSPATNAETIIASLTIPTDEAVASGIYVIARAAFTVGTSGVSVRLRLKPTDAAGTAFGDTGAVTETAANLDVMAVSGFLAGNLVTLPGQVIVCTMIVASGAAISTVSGVSMLAMII